MKDKLKIGILYVCTGAYDIFFPPFFASAEKYFLPEAEKHYFVFTDSHKEFLNDPRITRVEQKDLGWPDNTLKRFHMFDRITEQLRAYDYLFFFNANMEFMMPIHCGILPEKGLLAVLHPGYYDSKRCDFTYETNPKSTAYIPPEEGTVYVAGGLSGGSAAEYIAMYQELKRRIDADLQNGIIAVWHDESQWNRYIIGRDDVTLLDPGYCYPDLYDLPGYLQKIRLVWKQTYMDVWKLRNVKPSLKTRIYEWKSRRKIEKYCKKREDERQKALAAGESNE